MSSTAPLKGRNAIVTGSTSGIGLGIAKAFAQAGANVVINGLGSAEENEPVRAEVAEAGTKVLFSGANMMKPEAIDALVADARAELGQIDILVNNVGIQHVAPIEEFPVGKWDAI
ncbi:unnamed protein product, partial [Discosporangium mesarthrocarpum]